MIRAAIIATALLLAGCGTDAADGYQFGKATFEAQQPNITIVTHPTMADLRRAAPPGTYDKGKVELMAWARIRQDSCEIHVIDPHVAWKPEWLGHEVAHCVWGEWH